MTAKEPLSILQTDAVAQHVLTLPTYGTARLYMARWNPSRRPDVVPLDRQGAVHGCATELAQDESAHGASAGRGHYRHGGVALPVAYRARDGCCAGVGRTVRRVSDDGPPVPRGCGRGAIPDSPAADVSRLGSHRDPPQGGPHP